ncbi:isoleucine--tRNA ligase [Candidatus Roizmanbacteria bacterium RIFOXYC1_FULL_38_14]|uniref:Isoleucine--tRNA ligase n=1 Tax=Candidatus Roizmanbacteria bacterium RIFOXYD1_FULL_38_12 TaxID=1802093 RepID=A0A1F7L074_9BACT|nr:MAG: isoleucine--tRNA ligase [Candidatus Roizmanbacteria bacterium RIFOXYA2_FULL_38_14]OGK63540.1 MAG: isoleucine--tRNA ligase [Candidatus Roizmanbacteria bacterium RIFOXYA1_FULL_37_12]OGK65386.1 MAG: isoleucine--tRNA ligase [Candidatus Roizmanbacteria bacterium RIFOXYB1_FULL_40_23]OGK69791.1 MAG: isoleucine--tRNA ligase [Candidatus Roizmanbacteria bacterium RIFOXYC1_FULL_38_14]OGK73533.1 MAG: isoleucine--tRNA ligase [Candidatus Roizmanbacteria bacterium RIFOXYD1_FULL_38_12]
MPKPVQSNPDFPLLEKELLTHWYKDGIVDKYLHKNDKEKKTFSFLDGPITANNPMGAHHAWGRTYKDLWPRFFNLMGYRQRFQNGFDCQGLWVEVEVEKELGLRSKKDIENLVPGDRKASIAKFVQLCKDRVVKFSKIQTEQSKRLGYFADWNHSYFTMSEQNNYMIWHFLKKCHEHGWIYKGHESVPWCPRCETAISQHEMLTEDYKEVVHESVYLELKLKNKNEFLLIWTTTPWTIPANIAVAVENDYDYALVQGTTNDLFWVAKDAVERVFGKGYKKIIKTVKGRDLVGLTYEAPFDGIPAVKKVEEANKKNFHTVVATDQTILPITTTEGTGLVHTAVSAGTEDFKLGKKYGLPMIPVIADNADYLPTMGFLSGKNAKKHPELILDFLKEKDCVFKIERYKHRYPACWRCKAELVWKVADEWYIAMDSPSRIQKSNVPSTKLRASKSQNLTLRQRMINVAKQIKWMPEFGLDRELDWLKNMHDWLISKKNRYWGLALPIYECKGCGTFEVVGSKDELKKRAVSGWSIFEGHSPHKPFIDEVTITCKKCNKEVKRIDDVGNPWLDAGIVPYSTIMDKNQGEPLYLGDKEKWKDWFPANFITESFPGQFKNWFYAMIAMSSVLENTNPFERVLGYGTMLGEDGRAMHKSWGNSIEFNEGADKIGVDVMRWMFARQNPADNMLFGYKKADEVRRQFYLMLWNVNKFFVEYANLDKFEVQDDKINLKSKNILDTWILSRLASLIDHTEKSFREFNAKEAALSIEKFVADVSTWFIRRSRDRVWVNSDDTNDKQYFYTTLRKILIDLSIIISPIVPFISEMIFTNLTDYESVHLTYWPKTDSLPKPDDKMFVDMEIVREMAEAGQRARKEQKIKVRQPLNSVRITAPVSKKFHIEAYREEYLRLLRLELNVKKVELGISKDDVIYVQYDIILTEELKFEGKLRELMREIQSKRKELGTKPDQFVILTLPKDCMKFAEFLRKKILAHKIEEGNELNVSL